MLESILYTGSPISFMWKQNLDP